MRLNNTQKQRIREAIAQAEAHTSGEVVTVIAQKSDSYRFVSLFWAALLGICLPAIASWLGYFLPLTFFITAQLGCFALCWLLIDYTPLKYYLVPTPLAHYRASQKAAAQFIAQGVHLTENHTGILLFVSVAEHYVEVLADKGINDVVPQEKWNHIVADFITQVRANKIEQGFVDAITACGDILSDYVPQVANDKNELHDHLIEID